MESVDLYDPHTLENPYEAYEALRDLAPVYQIPDTNMFVVSRYEDIVDVSRQTSVFAQGPAPGEALIKDPGALQFYRDHGFPRPEQVPLGTDPPVHRRYRKMVDSFFSARGSEQQRELISQVAHTLIDGWIDNGQVAFVRDFAVPLPVHIITVMMGFPMDAIPDLRRWSDAWVRPFAGRLTPDEERYVAEQGVEWQRYILEIVEQKRENPDGSVLSRLGNDDFADVDGTSRKLREDEIVYMVDQVHVGGNETTAFALTSALWLLLSHRDIYDRVRSDRRLVPKFIEECLRLESPTQGMFRHTTQDVEMHGVLIPKGATVHLRFAAANRDHRVFANPGAIDLDRPNGNRHLAFGQGEHHCVGAGLTRLEQTIALGILLDRLDDMWLVDPTEVVHKPSFVQRGLMELHIGFTPAQ